VTTGLAAGVHARLLARAKQRHEDFNLLLTRYAVERFLYRLSISDARDRYWLKGALLFDLQWRGFLARNRLEPAALSDVIGDVRRFLEEPLRLVRERRAAW
jgi:hypothetical protein